MTCFPFSLWHLLVCLDSHHRVKRTCVSSCANYASLFRPTRYILDELASTTACSSTAAPSCPQVGTLYHQWTGTWEMRCRHPGHTKDRCRLFVQSAWFPSGFVSHRRFNAHTHSMVVIVHCVSLHRCPFIALMISIFRIDVLMSVTGTGCNVRCSPMLHARLLYPLCDRR